MHSGPCGNTRPGVPCGWQAGCVWGTRRQAALHPGGGPCQVLRTTRPQPLAPSRGFRLQHWPPLGSLHTGPFARAQLQTDDRPAAGALAASPTWACNVALVATTQGRPLSWGPSAVPGLSPGSQSLGQPPPEVQLLSLPVLSVLRLISPQQPVTLLCTPSPSRRGRPPARGRFCPQRLQKLGCAGELPSCHLAFLSSCGPQSFQDSGTGLSPSARTHPSPAPKNCSFCHIACLSAQGFLQARVPSPAHLLPWHPHQEVVRHPWPPPLSVLGLKRRGAAVPAWPPRRPSLLARSPCASSGTPGSTAQNRGGGGGSRGGQASGWSPGGWPWLVASIGQSLMPGASHRPLHPVCPGLAALVCAAALGPPGVSADPRSVLKAGGLEHIHGPPSLRAPPWRWEVALNPP